VVGVVLFIGYWALALLQLSATVAGLSVWTGWPMLVCSFLAGIVTFAIPFPLLTFAAGIAGAHYGWGWSWIGSVVLFTFPLCIFLVIAALSGVSNSLTRSFAWRPRKT